MSSLPIIPMVVAILSATIGTILALITVPLDAARSFFIPHEHKHQFLIIITTLVVISGLMFIIAIAAFGITIYQL